MTRKRTGTPWMPAPEFARTLTGLTVNLLVRDVAASLPFYTEVLGLRSLYSDEDFAALEGPEGWHMMLHADHTLDHSPTETARLSEPGKRGTGAEIRVLGLPFRTAGVSAGSKMSTATCSRSASRLSSWRR